MVTVKAQLHQPHVGAIGTIVAVEIVPEESSAAYLLIGIGDAGQSLTDTWHQTIEEAKAQAAFEYGVELSDWK
jgi:hypothetical protein